LRSLSAPKMVHGDSFSIIIGQPAWAVKDGQATVWITVYSHPHLDIVTAIPVRWDLQRDPFEAHTVVMAHSALMLLAEDVIQGAPDPGHLGCAFLAGCCNSALKAGR
jgi:hypothetical protein